jgi:hypothetical protein
MEDLGRRRVFSGSEDSRPWEEIQNRMEKLSATPDAAPGFSGSSRI